MSNSSALSAAKKRRGGLPTNDIQTRPQSQPALGQSQNNNNQQLNGRPVIPIPQIGRAHV